MSNSSRVYGLDILRAYAILIVVAVHSQDLLLEKNILRQVITFFSTDGVSLFFVLSGFLIGGILIRTIYETEFTSKELFNFWIRRWFRTLPTYFLVLVFFIIYNLYTQVNPNPLPWFNFLIFTQNFASPPPLHFFEEAWSLSVEEWFYLIIPFALYLSLRFTAFEKNKIILFWICVIIVLVTLLRTYKAYKFNYYSAEEWDNNLRKQVVTRLDSLMYGFLGVYLNYYCQIKIARNSKIALFIIGLSILFIPNINDYLLHEFMWNRIIYRNYFELTMVPLGTLLLFPLLLAIKTGKGIIYKSITFISLISYSLYLAHSSLIRWIIMPALNEKISFSAPVYYVLYFVISIGLAYVLYNYYEKPMTRLRDVVGKKKTDG